MSTTPPLPQQPYLSLPATLRAGDLFTFAVQTLLAPGCSVFYALTAVVSGTPTRILLPAVVVDINSVATFTIPSATTGAWAPGRYDWVCFSLDTSTPPNRDQLAQGKLIIQPDPAGANPADTRTYNQRLLDNIRALLTGKSLADVGMYKIGGRELTKLPLADLQSWEAIIEARVLRERRRRGENVPSSTIGITFGGR